MVVAQDQVFDRLIEPLLDLRLEPASGVLVDWIGRDHAIGREGGNVVVGAERRASGEITVSVSDTGIGIDIENLDRVFAPFIQADGTLQRTFEGTGLGLPLVKSLGLPLVKSMIDLHGGRAEIVSAVGEGTTVTLVFPADRVVDKLQADEQEAAPIVAVGGASAVG